MYTHLYLAPAASGKTTTLATQARALSAGLAATPRIAETVVDVCQRWEWL